MSADSIKTLWTKLEAWLENHAPGVADSLLPGAIPIQIREIEEELGLKFPAELVQFYSCHNGELSGSLCMGCHFLPLDQIAYIYGLLNDYHHDDYTLVRKGKPTEESILYSASRIPFLGSDGSSVCIESSSVGKNQGEVIYVDRDG